MTETITCPVTGVIRHYTNSFDTPLDVLVKPKLTRQTCDLSCVIDRNPSEKPSEEWYVDNYLHSVADQPARVYPSKREWYFEGLLHRENNPAVVTEDTEEWYEHGERHRAGGPAIVNPHYLEWWTYGRLVRTCMLPERGQ
jgi:hypothetical protein